MGIAPDLNPLLDQLRGVAIPENMSGEDAVNLVRVLLLIRGVVDHLAATMTGVLDRCGVAASQGLSLIHI